MKKETAIAIVFGIILGGIVATLLILRNKELQLAKNKAFGSNSSQSAAAPATSQNIQSFTLDAPQDGEIVYTNSVTIKGSANKGSLIVIQSPIKDLIVKNDNEQFSEDFPLSFGENAITITVYPPQAEGKSQEKRLRIYYLKQSL